MSTRPAARAGAPDPGTGPAPAPGDPLAIEGVPGGPWMSEAIAVSGDTLTMSAPRRAGTPACLGAGRAFLLAYAVRQVPCEVDAEWVEGPVRVGDDLIVIARMTGAPRRLQRRHAVRVPVSVIVRASIDGREGDTASIGAVTENLSAGGALLRIAHPVDDGTRMTLTIPPPGGDDAPVRLAARAVRRDREPGHEHRWRVAVAFDRPSPAHQDRLVRWIFRLQRERRARETGMGS